MGVNLFFALSGFLITGILVDMLGTRHFFRIFYARRVLRIFPLYYGFLLVLLCLTNILRFSWGGWQYFYLTYTANLAFGWTKPLALSYFRIGHFWSLHVEEQFYLVWPLIVHQVKDGSKLIRICLVVCILALTLRIILVSTGATRAGNIYLPYSFTLCCCDNLFYGCVLSLLLRTKWRYRIQLCAPYIFAICALSVVAERIIHRGASWTHSFFMPTFGFSLIGIASAALIAMALTPTSFTHRCSGLVALRLLGKYSYGIYVFHYSVHGFLTEPLQHFFSKSLHLHVASIILSAIVVTCVSVLMAILSYHLYEIKFLKMKRYFRYTTA